MPRRYSNIKKGTAYKRALDNYIEYLTNPPPSKRLTGGNVGTKKPMTAGVVTPFGKEMSGTSSALVTMSQRSLDEFGAQFSNRLRTGAQALGDSTKLTGYKPAKANIFRSSGGTRSYEQSKITKLWYLKYEGESFSLPFGAIADNEEESAAGATIKQTILASLTGEYSRVSISSEKIKV